MKKRFLVLTLVLLFGFVLVACQGQLTVITFSGADNETLDFDADFDVLEGVVATGDNGEDYSDLITYTSTSAISADHKLDTKVVGNHAVRYDVTVDEVTAQFWRYITVESPKGIDGAMLVNPDFSLGTAGWDDPSVVYEADGGTVDLSAEDGAIKAVVVAGSNVWTPRFGQMNIPFEQDKTYEITFEAKSSVPKTINLQVGEILPSSPYWDDFKEGLTVHRDITTEWATYSFEFTHTKDNKRGGLLFELGTINSVGIDATMWFDNVTIEETVASPDILEPVFSGVSDTVSVLLGQAYDPATGVTVFDVKDGDLTDDIVIVIEDSLGAVVTAIDTDVEGDYTVTYTVEDAAGNVATATTEVSVVSLVFSDTNLVANPSFADALDTTDPEWEVYSTSYTVVTTHDETAGTLALDISGTGSNVYDVQLFQEGYITLEQGKTYRLQFNASASVARTLHVTLGYGLDADPWYVEYARQNDVALTTTEATYEFLFTVAKDTHDVKLVFELGNTAGFAAGVVTFYDVKLNELDAEPIVMNSQFDELGWIGFSNDWEGSVATFTPVNGEFKFELTKYTNGTAGHLLQLIYGEKLVLEAETDYVFTFDAYASKALAITPFFTQGEAGGWNNLVTTGAVDLTTTKASYTLEFTTGTSMTIPFEFKFEFGLAFAPFDTGSEFIIFDNLSMKKDVVDAAEILVNGNAESIIGGHGFFTEGAATGSMVYSDEGALITVGGTLGVAHQPHYYYIIDELAAGTYTVVMKITASVARDLRFNIILPNAGYASILPDSKYDFETKVDEMVTVSLTFTTVTMLENVKIELDFGTLGDPLVSSLGTFTLHELLIYPNYS